MGEKCQNNEWKCFLKRQKITAHKHKEAFSTLVESQVQMTCIDFTNFLKLAEFKI